MAPTSSNEHGHAAGRGEALDERDRRSLMEVARTAIARGAAQQGPWSPDPSAYSERLRRKQACFVTLHLDGALRGCVGTLRATQPLVVEAGRSAHAAAYRDPRFPPVEVGEVGRLDIHISVLSEPERLPCLSECELLEKLRPGVDGLILSDGEHTGTFLPDVWAKIPDPAEFVMQLKLKAGLSADHWSTTFRIERYTTQGFS
jgi:AmmeMemoRadiSam system protein A